MEKEETKTQKMEGINKEGEKKEKQKERKRWGKRKKVKESGKLREEI